MYAHRATNKDVLYKYIECILLGYKYGNVYVLLQRSEWSRQHMQHWEPMITVLQTWSYLSVKTKLFLFLSVSWNVLTIVICKKNIHFRRYLYTYNYIYYIYPSNDERKRLIYLFFLI